MVQRFHSGFFYSMTVIMTLLCGLALPTYATTILFIGNSFTFADKSPVHFFHKERVTDLNMEGIGGVPALFQYFAEEAGVNYDVSLETAPGKGLEWHYQNKADVISKAWDVVVMHGYSTLDEQRPGDPGVLIQSTKAMAALLHEKNPLVTIHLMATWSRADETYQPEGHWYNKPIDTMAKDVRAGYNLAAAASPFVKDVIPVGEAWNRAITTNFADANPYDGLDAGKVDLWSYDHYHGSMYGYYLEALTIFGNVTGLDPRSLTGKEYCAEELGISPAQATAMQQIAFDELRDAKVDLKLLTVK